MIIFLKIHQDNTMTIKKMTVFLEVQDKLAYLFIIKLPVRKYINNDRALLAFNSNGEKIHTIVLQIQCTLKHKVAMPITGMSLLIQLPS
jgi:hypothetical protein